MQAIVVDLDAGDIGAKLEHLIAYLGRPTLIVESGGRTVEGTDKLHIWWKLSEPASGNDLELLCRLRGEIAVKVGGDTHFRSAHQPIRVAGSVYHKGGSQRLVQIREHNSCEVHLHAFADLVDTMPPLIGAGAEPSASNTSKPSLQDVLITPVREEGADPWTRFEGASAAIGHYIRLAHEGRISPDEGWEAICGYNAAMLRPAWPLERLQQEADRLWALHIRKNGPAVLRNETDIVAQSASIPVFSFGELLDDRSPMPPDIISPRLLTPGGLLVLGGAPKVGKSDFLISMLAHMSAGVPFLGFTPQRSLNVFYLQAEIQYHYLRERMQHIRLDAAVIAGARDRLFATSKLRLILDDKGLALLCDCVRKRFPDQPPDIICIDPIRNLFDSGKDGGGENDNAAMMFFLTERVEKLREAVAPECGIILAHHTKKLAKQQLKDDPFLALSGASALRGFYTSGLILHRPEEDAPQRKLEIELRNGPALPSKLIDKVNGQWIELNPLNERLVRQEVGAKYDAERMRKNETIIGLIFNEAHEGKIYTMTSFAESFENKAGLGGQTVIRDRLGVLTTKGYVKFVRGSAATALGLAAERSKYGYLCVEGMSLRTDEECVNPETGEVMPELIAVLPSHYKCSQTGAILPVENPAIWVYGEEDLI